MNMESQVSCREASDVPETVFIKDVITSETHHVAPNPPAKKQTRQWAAWTRQEEESFFNALRQVGKNFEKITSRVQSKNKDQVRHYYYRLVRRMNKLLGPELSLDAKNSKDTNAAMLRWWSLLEKYSCKASKLHLKPRRFKHFLESLEHQLLKDRKKNIKKRLVQGENGSINSSQGVSNQNNSKGDSSPVKQARQKKRSGGSSTAAYRKWEKAAIAGVSLVADAAAHLEQTALDKLVDGVQFMQGDDAVRRDIPPVPHFHQTMFPTNTVQPLTKLKLQLFPINESIRRALEMDNHNPHLELTLSCRKKISSVLEHINRKWGSCSIASGELMLLPYHAPSLNPVICQKWTQDSVLSAADVYAAIGSPPVFRLRYGWFTTPNQEPQPVSAAQRFNMNSVEEKGSQKNAGAVSVFEWADSLTNTSISDLLSDVNNNNINSNNNINNNSNSKKHANASIGSLGSQCSFSCDSFDAAIAAHIGKTIGNNNGVEPTVVSSSIWDAEETCDAFTFRKNNDLFDKHDTSAMSLVPSTSAVEKLPDAEEPVQDCHAEVDAMDECPSDVNPKDDSAKDLHALTDIYWPDSLGPLEVDVPPCRYQSNDLILSESLGGLTRILTSSLDAFFFGVEQRVGDRESTPVNIVP
ncbi:putative transcription factor MYB-HB-like family [Helianthus annuus]|uniref:Putative TSL-kinase interacting protein 1 n=1 Tax=Helianthus annuus TaxID=4232 RepID=A0A251VJ08_HELAN|nr:TSL-kinase interacting protein 1 [Helianthus annuus]KAF5799210.1 putative transcription factor MYB/SANT family [Helianthus annuus]KAJ0550676.1 putative transcription factor MYB/SANT family [Helianthus annuus]KAJ0563642.1 putative transcription factor MYB/SANT family [Helianthus annuus]KAJ0728972.1 putative transcription factor MYB/SANT family [Helianthus annuus]KAJ0731731.1 putative transcription factor MYB/SANT family [Helianthus annuus]